MNTVFQNASSWCGRLILPSPEQRRPDGSVLVKLEAVPEEAADLRDRVVALRWSGSESLKADSDITFGAVAKRAVEAGRVLPNRLDGWKQVKPLESLAGGRPQDDLRVALGQARWDGQTLVIEQAPVEISGPQKGLAQIVGAQGQDLQVRWMDQLSGQLSGIQSIHTTVRQDRADLNRLQGETVWLHGHTDEAGQFEALGLTPTKSQNIRPDQTRVGLQDCLHTLKSSLWTDTPSRANSQSSTFLSPDGDKPRFQEGQRYLVMHTFGGLAGGKEADPKQPFGIVPGHFSYGTAQVKEQAFDITYDQVYGQGPDGIIAGKQSWDAYVGDFERGWLSTRPVIDMMISCPALEKTYQLGDKSFNFFQAMDEEMNRMEARYRSGDGDGQSPINAATSCTQDSASAMYAVIERLEELRRNNPAPADKDFQELVSLARDLKKVYTPFGKAPKAWKANAARTEIPVQGIMGDLGQGVLTFKTILPRQHQENVGEVFLRHGAQIFVQQTAAVGAAPGLTPLAPSYLFSHQ